MLAILTCSFVFFVACTPTNNVRNITPQEAYKMMNSLDGFIIIDVRTATEFRQERIEHAINVPYDTITQWAESQLEKGLLQKDTIILVYCQRGRRSRIASQRLVELGFTNIYDFGGIAYWSFNTISG